MATGPKTKLDVTLTKNTNTYVGPVLNTTGATHFWVRVWQDSTGIGTGKITSLSAIPPSQDGTTANYYMVNQPGASGLTVQPSVTKAATPGAMPNLPQLFILPFNVNGNGLTGGPITGFGVTWPFSTAFLNVTVDNTDATNNITHAIIEVWPVYGIASDPNAHALAGF